MNFFLLQFPMNNEKALKLSRIEETGKGRNKINTVKQKCTELEISGLISHI